MRDSRSGHVGTAKCFISHAWKHRFLDVVESILDYYFGTHRPFLPSYSLVSFNAHRLFRQGEEAKREQESARLLRRFAAS